MKISKLSLLNLILFTSLSLIFSGCNQEEPSADDLTAFELQVSDAADEDLNIKPSKWHVTNKKILVVFGYDFNKPEVVKEIKNALETNFGLEEDGGMISTVVYPDDFRHGQRTYISELTSILNATEELSGVVLLGAPENTHIALARHQDFWNQEVPYPIMAVFPQDDVLGLEATCDIVLDKGQSAEITGEIVEDEVESEFSSDSAEMIMDIIRYISLSDGSFEPNASLKNHIFQMLRNKKLHHYSDPETGLQSINHFVLN